MENIQLLTNQLKSFCYKHPDLAKKYRFNLSSFEGKYFEDLNNYFDEYEAYNQESLLTYFMKIGYNYTDIMKFNEESNCFENSELDFENLLSTIQLAKQEYEIKKALDIIPKKNYHDIKKAVDDISRSFTLPEKRVKKYSEHLEDFYKELGTDKPILKFDKFPFINETTAILEGNLVVVSGFSGGGKSTLLFNLAYDLVLKGINTAVLSLEMSLFESIANFEAIDSGLPYKDFISRKNKEYKGKGKDNLYLADIKKCKDLSMIFNYLHNVKANKNVSVVFIDQLSHINNSKRFNSEYERINDTTFQLKQFALENDIVIFLGAQINRDGKDKADETKIAGSLKVLQESDYLFSIGKAINLRNEPIIQEYCKSHELKQNEHYLQILKSRHTDKANTGALLEQLDSRRLIEKVEFLNSTKKITIQSKVALSLSEINELA